MSVRAREREFDGMTVRRAVRLRTSPTRPFSWPARATGVALNLAGAKNRADEGACLDARAIPQTQLCPAQEPGRFGRFGRTCGLAGAIGVAAAGMAYAACPMADGIRFQESLGFLDAGVSAEGE